MDETLKDIPSLPVGFKLLPGEVLQKVVTPNIRRFSSQPSSLEQILRLTNARDSSEIGHFGPSIAALAFEAVSLDDTGLSAPDHLRLYDVVFGRDSLRVAIELIPSFPELARTTVLELAKLQGVQYNQAREEEPGRIVHEVRDKNSRIARELTESRGWDWPYYGTVDATPEYIRTLAAYCQISEENRAFLSEEYIDLRGQNRTIAFSLEMAVDWINARLDSNPEGLLEFQTVLPKGIENQVWKDSWDAYHHADGTIANHDRGIAAIEVQVTAYNALLDASVLYDDVLELSDTADQLRARAERLKQTILSLFWTEDKGGYFVIGTDRDEDGQLRQLQIRTSNMGHIFNSDILTGDDPEIVRKREAVIRQLMSPKMLNVSGIRTLASDEVRFRPGAYHNGSVWLWDTHHIAKGMRRLGYDTEAEMIDRKLLNIVNTTHIFPEYVRGDDAVAPDINQRIVIVKDLNNGRENTVEQPPQEIQAWTVAAILSIKHRIGHKS